MDTVEIHLDIDSNFEPQSRARSNTWPLRPSRDLEPQNSPVAIDESSNGDQHAKDPLGLTAKKSGSRRNAWGNLSYADLITKAIQSTPEKRLTLSQIYDWMVQNVPYFKDKGDSTSSAGWKNSIRHNLSLHNRFMRVQNEGTGKSSWWVLNPDAKPGKTPRRRAGSMETKSLEKKRGRIRKKVEALRAMENGETLSPGGSDDILDALTFGDFRPRASSNASSSGRLSPIRAVIEPDLHENQVPPMSPIPWETEVSGSPTMYSRELYHDLVNSLVVGMKLSNQEGIKMEVTDMAESYSPGNNTRDYSSQSSPFMDMNNTSPGLDNHYSHMSAPPPYPKQQQQSNGLEYHTSNFSNQIRLQCSPNQTNDSSTFPQSELFNDDYLVINIKQEPAEHSPTCLGTPNSLSVNTQHLSSPDRSGQGSPNVGSYTRLSPQPVLVNGQLTLSPLTCQVSPQQNRHLVKTEPSTSSSLQHQQQVLHQSNHDSILREALTRGPSAFRSQSSTNTPSPTYSPLGSHSPLGIVPTSGNMSNGSLNRGLTLNSSISPRHQSLNGVLLHRMDDPFSDDLITVSSTSSSDCSNNNNTSVPLDIDIDLMGISGLDYDMDQVIKQELSLEGNLDFNFDAGPSTSVGQSVVH